MNDMKHRDPADAAFLHRLSAAAATAWWVVLVSYAILMLNYCFYLWATANHPAWYLAFWGPNFDWLEVQRWWLAATIVFKLSVWAEAMLALWLTLWARRLRSS